MELYEEMKMKTRMRTKQKKRRTKNFLTVISFFLILGAIFGVGLYFAQKPVVELSSTLSFPAGKGIRISQIVKEVKYGTLLNGDDLVESMKSGTKSVKLSLKRRSGEVMEHFVTVEFYDAAAPVITGPEEVLVTVGKEAAFKENFSALDDTGVICPVAFSGTYDKNTPGTYPMTASAKDGAGNEGKKTFSLVVLALPYDKDGNLIDGTYLTEKGFEIVVKNKIATVDGLVLANKSYSLPKSYNPGGLDAALLKAYQTMTKDAEKDGIYWRLASQFRTWGTQKILFDGYVVRDGLEEALATSARPGHSEHQTGLAIDIATSNFAEAKVPAIIKKLDWLNENAYRYGFALRYPEGKSHITGYSHEPWHYRYVGEELAKTLYNNGDWITLEEYYGIDSVYRGYN